MTVLRSHRVVTDSGVRPASIHLDDERIGRVSTYDDVPADVIDYGNLVIMPGLVDSHVHVNEPGRTEWEGFETATSAAAAGGITTIVDMPLNSIPPTTTLEGFLEKRRNLEGKCRIDVALWGGVIPGNLGELAPMLEAGARGFKCFLVHSGVDEFPNVDETELRAAAQELARHGAPLLVHAELPGPLDDAARSIDGADPNDYLTYVESRPPEAEDQAIELLYRVCSDTGARIHVVHLSSSSALPILARAQKASLPMTAETTPHYLHFGAEAIPYGRSEYKCAPPIRSRENRERLWEGLAGGLIDMVVSDHSPCNPELKRGDFLLAWGGISSVQFVLPIVWTEAKKRGHSIEELSVWLCRQPAKLARLDQKGVIAPGRDADFVIWSPDGSFTVDESIIEHRHKITPYRDEELQGVVKATWLRGRKIFEQGKHLGMAQGGWLG